MPSECDDLSGLSWAWCYGTSTAASSYDSAVTTGADTVRYVADRAGASADYATAAASSVASASVQTAGAAVRGAQTASGALAKAFRPQLTAGGVATVAALGVGGLLLADAYQTGGTVTRRAGRAVAGGRR